MAPELLEVISLDLLADGFGLGIHFGSPCLFFAYLGDLLRSLILKFPLCLKHVVVLIVKELFECATFDSVGRRRLSCARLQERDRLRLPAWRTACLAATVNGRLECRVLLKFSVFLHKLLFLGLAYLHSFGLFELLLLLDEFVNVALRVRLRYIHGSVIATAVLGRCAAAVHCRDFNNSLILLASIGDHPGLLLRWYSRLVRRLATTGNNDNVGGDFSAKSASGH